MSKKNAKKFKKICTGQIFVITSPLQGQGRPCYKKQQLIKKFMKSKYYTICKLSRGEEWANVAGLLANETSKAAAKRAAKEWAAALRQTVSVWRISTQDNGRGDVATFAEYIGVAEVPVYLRNLELTAADICGNWAE